MGRERGREKKKRGKESLVPTAHACANLKSPYTICGLHVADHMIVYYTIAVKLNSCPDTQKKKKISSSASGDVSEISIGKSSIY